MRPQSTTERFWSRVDRSGGLDACWPWTAGTFRGGYGQFVPVHRHATGAHRFSYALEHGPIPDGLDVLHACDNPPCVNPAHLFLGTARDNALDMASKGRANHGGEHNGAARLNREQVVSISGRMDAGESIMTLAAEYGLPYNTLWNIRAGRTWQRTGEMHQ